MQMQSNVALVLLVVILALSQLHQVLFRVFTFTSIKVGVFNLIGNWNPFVGVFTKQIASTLWNKASHGASPPRCFKLGHSLLYHVWCISMLDNLAYLSLFTPNEQYMFTAH